ncbi:MAG: anaphase-promoting complex subunit cdc27 [Claussenomyces sp. TS43310]|nr:MAG: anaphase-promoting complex subunit cdc27 [Claussenomyces sp. TS43310]
MAPSTLCITSQLRQHVYYHIDNNLLKNALFLAERLVACDIRSSESVYLLSLCHLRLADYKSAYEYSKQHGSRGTHLGCAYVFAQASLALGSYKDGIVALEKSRGLWGGRNSFGKHTQTSRYPYPDAAAIYCLLGKLYQGYDDKKKAVSFFEEALRLSPFMWDAFTTLCDMGARVHVPNIFKASPEMESTLRTNSPHSEIPASFSVKDLTVVTSTGDSTQNRSTTRSAAVVSDYVDPFNNAPSRGFAGGLFGSLGLSQKINESNPASASMPAAGGGGIGPEAMETPTGPSATIDASIVAGGRAPGVVSAFSIEPPQAPIRRNRTLQGIGMDFSMDAPKMSRGASSKRSLKTDASLDDGSTSIKPSAVPTAGGERKRTVSGQVVQPRHAQVEDPGAPQRRSVRLFNQIRPSSSKTSTAGSSNGTSQGRELKKAKPPISRMMKPTSSTSTVGRIVSGNREPRRLIEDSMDIDAKDYRLQALQNANGGHASIRSSELEPVKQQEEAMKWLLDLFKKLGNGYYALSQFQCHEAIQIYGSLPSAQQNTPWVLAQMGRAYFEQAAYGDAETYYRRIRSVAPTRFADMEVYSTILWHLKRETDLSFLAHELVDADWTSPQAWCALGNAWSMARDHEQALRCFKRATQLDPKFAYAFTLQGHEYVANEEYDKALSAYRHGMAADKRHYNAYYGVGRVYEKLGQYEKAFTHFEAAARINPTNAVLICCIGTVLEKQKRPREALQYFTKATDLAPRSALTRFKKARALMAIGELQIALQELMILKDIAPDEAMVHFLLGRLYKTLREKGAAVRHFTIALNLDPKASQQIKEAIESLEVEDEEYDEASMMA